MKVFNATEAIQFSKHFNQLSTLFYISFIHLSQENSPPTAFTEDCQLPQDLFHSPSFLKNSTNSTEIPIEKNPTTEKNENFNQLNPIKSF